MPPAPRSLALLTDLYQLTMAYGHWKLGTGQRQAAFHLTFRKPPFDGGFTIACGLHAAIDYLENLRFDGDDLHYLASLAGNDGRPLFERGFLDFLGTFQFACDVDAVPEGTAVFPNEPLVRVVGPILHAQLVETALLTLVNFETLIATKAARVCIAAAGDPVIEFGLRRAQGPDGGLSAARAAYAGGCAATSDVLAGRLHGIPVRGTHAHAWVLAFDDEQAAFDAWADAQPNNAVFLVDTYDSVRGVARAIESMRRIRAAGHEPIGIRLDSGDLAHLSIEARRMLDAAGFEHASILASNDLDEHVIQSLKHQGARINVWGVGTKLVTAYDQPALGGVYKLSAVRDAASDPWQYKLKLSEQAAKVSTPGVLQVRRFIDADRGCLLADAIYDEAAGAFPMCNPTAIVDVNDPTLRAPPPAGMNVRHEELLVPIFRGGRRVYDPPPLSAVRNRAAAQVAALPAGAKRFLNPHRYPHGLERSLHELKTKLILEARGEGVAT